MFDLFLALATWRITSLLTEEDGPADIFITLRAVLKPIGVLECFWCASVWVGWILSFDLIKGLAYSAVAILIYEVMSWLADVKK
jgi:hypothetical protein